MPGDDEKEPAITDLRLRLGITARTVVERGLQVCSLQLGRPVALAEAVEILFAKLVEKDGTSVADLDALAQSQREARKDLLAEQQRRQPLVWEARALAQSMGLAAEGEECQELEGVIDSDRPVEHFANEFLQAMEITLREFPARDDLGTGSATDRGGSEWEELKILRAECPARDVDRTARERPRDENIDRDDGWQQVLAAHQTVCPDNESVILLANDWRNRRLRFNEEARLPTPAQRREMLRRDGYCCSTPGCCNHLWLEVHHVVLYSRKGKTVDSNLVTLCSRCHKNVHRGHLRISGQAPDKLVFRDRNGHDLQRAHGLGVAGWLDFWCGWTGSRDDSHQHRWAEVAEPASKDGISRVDERSSSLTG